MLFMIAGESFTGKSVSAGTFPKPMKYLEFDANGAESLKHAKGKDGKLIVPDWEQIDVVSLVKQKVHDLSFVTDMGGRNSKSEPPAHTSEALDVVAEYNKVMADLRINKEGYHTVVIDSLTSMFRIWKEMILWVNKIPHIRQNDYGTLEGVLGGQFLPNLRALPVKYVILVNHLFLDMERNKDGEETGVILGEYPVAPSRPMGKNMGKYIDELYRQKIEGGEYVWRTKRSGFFQAGSRLNVPDPIKPATFQELSKYINTGGK